MVSPTVRQCFVVSGILLQSFGSGAMHGYLAVLLAQYQDSQGRPLNASDVSWIGSVLGMTKFIGVLTSLALMSRFGRQKALLISTIPAIAGWVIYCTCDTVPLFILARIMHGVALGLKTTCSPLLIAEYTHPVFRGSFIGAIALSIGLGMWFSHVVGAALTWKMAALVCGLVPVIGMTIIVLSPESPSWLASHKRTEEARKAFVWLRGHGTQEMRELDNMIENAGLEQKVCWNSFLTNFTGTTRETVKILKYKMFYKPVLISMCMHVTLEFSGNHIMASYGNKILQLLFEKENISDVSWMLTSFSILRVATNFAGLILLKHLRRRTILFTCSSMTILSYLMISLFMYLRRDALVSTFLLNALPMCLMFFYVVSFNLLMPLGYVIYGEIFPLAHRSLGSAVSATILTPATTTAMKSAPIMFASIGLEGSFMVFAGVLVVCLCLFYPSLPETKDKTLEHIENSFRGKKHNRDAETTLLRKSEDKLELQ